MGPWAGRVDRRRDARAAVVVSLAVGYAWYCLYRMPVDPIVTPDSAGYLAFAPIRTLGYPAFVAWLGPKGTIVAQPILFGAALAWLGLETLWLTSSLMLAIAVFLASILVPDLTTYHATLLTESVFMSSSMALLAAVVRFERTGAIEAVWMAATAAGLASVVRSTGLAFVPVVPVMVWLGWQRWPASRRARTMGAAVLPLVVLVGGERLLARAVHGEEVTSLLGRHLFAKAGLTTAPPLARPSPDALRARLETHLDARFAPIRELLARASPDVRGVLTLYYEGCLQGPCVPELGPPLPWGGRQLNDVLLDVALSRISRAPVMFARVIATDYRSLWVVVRLRHPAIGRDLRAFVAANQPLPFGREAMALGPSDTFEVQPLALLLFIQPVVTAIGWFTGALAALGLGAAALRRPLRPVVAVACLASLTAHGGLLLSSLFAAGLARFAMALWPTVMTATLFGLWSLLPGTRVTCPVTPLT